MSADGSNQMRITLDPAIDQSPVWSPDGARIAFSRGTTDLHFSAIYVMNADGTNPVALTSGGISTWPAWSPDGQRLTFARLVGGTCGPSGCTGGRFQIAVMNADGSNVVDLTSVPDNGNPDWSPDGTRIAFRSSRTCHDLWVMNADGSGQTDLTNCAGESFDPSWAPDGSRLAFDSDRIGNFAIFTMNPDGTDVLPLTDGSANDLEPAWSPDGSRVAFQSNRDGNREIYTMAANGSAQTRLTTNASTDGSVSWQPITTPVSVFDSGFTPPKVKVDQGRPVSWHLHASDQNSHSITDRSGMGLFASGALMPDSYYTFNFTAAGTYKYNDVLHPTLRGSVRVPTVVSPASGSTSTLFNVRWASVAPQPDFVYDVQIKRPGSNVYVNFLANQTAQEGGFTPDAGPGIYRFRARIKHLGSGKHAGWSPPARISVM